MQTGLRLKNLKFFKGLRNYEENNSVGTDQIYSARNARFKNYVISSKQGYQAIGDTLAGGTKFRGIYEYPYSSGGVTTKRLLAIYNKIFRQYNSSTDAWDTIATTWPAVLDAETQGVLYNNSMYFINPMDDTGTPAYYTPAYLVSGTGADSIIGDWNDVLDGRFGITIDGVARNITGVDFSNCTTMDDVALTLQIEIRAVTGGDETVIWDLDHFVITSGNRTSASAITVTSTIAGGTDISGAGAGAYMDASAGRGTVTAAVASFAGIGKISNATFSVIDNSPRGTGIEAWVERLWVIGDYTTPNAVLASRAASAATPSNVEDWTTDPILELIGKGGKCTAIRVLNNELFVWKEDSIWYNTTDRIAAGETTFIELSRTGGAVNQKSTIVVENDVWFLTPALELRSLGLERNLGNNPRTRELTSIIQRTMDLLDPDQSNAVASYYKQVYKLHLKTRNSPTNNLTIVFDYNTGGWSIDQGQAVDMATVWDSSLVYTEDSSSGQAYEDDIGYDAAGSAFLFEFKTPFMDDNRPDTSKRARYLYIRGQQSFDQEIIIRLYRDADYNTYSEYTIQSPNARGIASGSNINDGQWGAREWGDQQWGGDGEDPDNVPMYRIQNDDCGDWLISVDRRCNMFAVGGVARINGGRVIIEQIGLKLIDDNENYKRSNQ